MSSSSSRSLRVCSEGISPSASSAACTEASVWAQAQMPQMPPGQTLFALHAADGTPIMLTDSREAAIANAVSQQLETVSVH